MLVLRKSEFFSDAFFTVPGKVLLDKYIGEKKIKFTYTTNDKVSVPKAFLLRK